MRKVFKVEVNGATFREASSTAVIERIDAQLPNGFDIDCSFQTLKREFDMLQVDKPLNVDTGVIVTRER